MPQKFNALRGRGTSENPANRFAALWTSREQEWTDPEDPAPTTTFLPDASRTILAHNDSPDVGFDTSMNPYRGCEHGCIYCYARPTHEYLGFSAGLDFETKILVKVEAPTLLREALSAPRWTPRVVAMSGVTDPYQPVERRLRLTRRCLEVFAEFRNPVVIITKNYLVSRDIDVLSQLAQHSAAAVYLSVTTLNDRLRQAMEPRTSPPSRRLATISALHGAGIPVGVLVAPVLPGLTDHEIPAIVTAAARAGAQFAGYGVLRLPHGLGPLFTQWLAEHVPTKQEKVLKRLQALRGGRLNDVRFGARMQGEGIFAEQIDALFTLACRKAGLRDRAPGLSTAAFRRPGGPQLPLFPS